VARRKKKKKSLFQVFMYYNRKYFGGKLKLSDLRLKKMSHLTAGETTFYEGGVPPAIYINKALTNWGRCVRIVLLHEMAHVSLPQHVEHGPRFKRRIRRLVKQGAYDDLL
jgi:hypothetical protein